MTEDKKNPQTKKEREKKHKITVTLEGDAFEVLDRIAHIHSRSRGLQASKTLTSVLLNYEMTKLHLGLL